MTTLQAFTDEEAKKAKLFPAAQVASMMGRKLEEGDRIGVYCQAEGIPVVGWSNLHKDVHGKLIELWKPVSDEHSAQLLLKALDDNN